MTNRRPSPPSTWPRARALAAGVLSVLALTAFGSGETGPAYDVPERTDAEVRALLESTCRAAVSGGQPVLLEFSAGWCVDSRKVHALRATPVLSRELERWEHLAINVGRFDRHDDLRQAFRVTSIATWVALRPTDCDQPVTAWPKLDREVFEPVSGPSRSAEDLARWLAHARRARGSR